MKKAFFNWSGGKDSSMALFKVLRDKEYTIEYLITTISKKYQRITQHGVRLALLKMQAESIDIPLKILELPEEADMESYNTIMKNLLEELKNHDIKTAFFGDIFLEDLRIYREKQLAKVDFVAQFPLWKKGTKELANDFIRSGFKAKVVCVDARVLDKSFVGRDLDVSFLNDLPENIDPCGENGEYHSFVYDGPIFKNAIHFEMGEVIHKTYTRPKEKSEKGLDKKAPEDDLASFGFWFCDLMDLKN